MGGVNKDLLIPLHTNYMYFFNINIKLFNKYN